ncbi:ABC transporter permease [Mesorhizobium sp. B2-4-6]|uniref:ABC transporter permease n=1 Tax=Mesorhizobium sp. B2-4-6 TaxID=2589943 RepID=UPI0011283988|nr:ABC transporter permease [Mesorhizobium sp. B2-4-6]TPL54316.1 ABC transporter permease [Mesorhizobium sp. B2-4-6]
MKHRSFLLYLPAALLLTPFFLAPMAVIGTESFSGPQGIGAEYAKVVTDQGIRTVLYNTFYVATMVTIFSLLIGYPIAYVLARLRGRWATIGIFLIFLPFWASTVIRSFAWMILLGRKGPVNSILVGIGLIEDPIRFIDNGLGLVIAMTYIMVPFIVVPILNGLRAIDPNLPRAAAVLGANPWRQFLAVTLPLSMPNVAVGCTIVFVTSLGFFVTPSLLGGDLTVVSMLISEQANRLLDWPLASSLAIIVLLLTIIIFALLRLSQLASRRKGKAQAGVFA